MSGGVQGLPKLRHEVGDASGETWRLHQKIVHGMCRLRGAAVNVETDSINVESVKRDRDVQGDLQVAWENIRAGAHQRRPWGRWDTISWCCGSIPAIMALREVVSPYGDLEFR